MAATVAPLDTGTAVRCRLARIEGQAAGLGRMWDAQRPAEGLLDQIAAVRVALRGVAIAIVRAAPHVLHHVGPLALHVLDPGDRAGGQRLGHADGHRRPGRRHRSPRSRGPDGHTVTMLASIPAPPITELHLGPLRVTLFGIVVALAVWHGGLVLFGGLTVGTLTALWLARRHRADLGAFAGAAAIGIPLAQALGRPADYFSQELFGIPSTLSSGCSGSAATAGSPQHW